MALCDSAPPRTPWRSPPGFSATPEALGPPSMIPTPEESPAGFFRRSETLSHSLFSTSWRPPAPAASASLDVASKVAPPTGAAPPSPPSAPILSNSPAVSVSLTSTGSPAVSASSFVAYASISSPLHLAIFSVLSSLPVTAHTVLPPRTVVLRNQQWVFSYSSPPACRCCSCLYRLCCPPLRPCRAALCPPSVPLSPT